MKGFTLDKQEIGYVTKFRYCGFALCLYENSSDNLWI